MATQSQQVITWCQPADSAQDDIIAVDGRFLSPTDVAERREAVSRLNDVARSDRRIELPVRGWKVVSRGGVAAQLPVLSDDPSVQPSVAVLVPMGDAAVLLRAVAQVIQTAELAGYRTSAQEVESALRYESPRPKGWVARLVQWIKNLFKWG